MDIEVVVEIPKGTRNKYEADHETGTTPGGWRSREVAERIVEEARDRYLSRNS
jgi:inorganic pyrophosphatase